MKQEKVPDRGYLLAKSVDKEMVSSPFVEAIEWHLGGSVSLCLGGGGGCRQSSRRECVSPTKAPSGLTLWLRGISTREAVI